MNFYEYLCTWCLQQLTCSMNIIPRNEMETVSMLVFSNLVLVNTTISLAGSSETICLYEDCAPSSVSVYVVRLA
jgi:hypothetical protein